MVGKTGRAGGAAQGPAEVIRQKGRILKKLNSPKPGSFVPYQMREAVTALLKALDYTEGKRVYH